MTFLVNIDGSMIKTTTEEAAKYLQNVKEEKVKDIAVGIAKGFITACYEACKEDIVPIDNPEIFQAIKNAREYLQEQIAPTIQVRDNLEQENKNLDYKIYMLEEKQHDYYMQVQELQSQLHKLGFLDGAKKKAIKAQIEALERPDVPEEYAKKIELNKAMIEAYDAKIYENRDIIIHGMKLEKDYQNSHKVPEKLQKAQKEEKVTTTKPTTRPSFKDKMKPLKPIL